ncbi:hypothetical protein GE09DRAFT_1228566 [Coniochaeta sp. 2T2.1]|nr:hypothetical protein GE09DRAFT_1228566 [Coniochaeta sp. 2T2.1]
MEHQDADDKREVDEVENKPGESDAFVIDKKLTRSGLWKLDRSEGPLLTLLDWSPSDAPRRNCRRLHQQAKQIREPAGVQGYLIANNMRVEVNRASSATMVNTVGAGHRINSYTVEYQKSNADFTPTAHMNNQAAKVCSRSRLRKCRSRRGWLRMSGGGSRGDVVR